MCKCQQCGSDFERQMGRVPKFCSSACRQKSYRVRKASTPSFPEIYLSQSRWVRANGKRPIQVSGYPASSTNPITWTTYQSVRNSGAGDGFGVMLGNGLGAYDFDNCFTDGELNPDILEFIRGIPEKVIFMEVSVSGNGLHVFFESWVQNRGYRKVGVEKYFQARFIRTTMAPYSLPGA